MEKLPGVQETAEVLGLTLLGSILDQVTAIQDTKPCPGPFLGKAVFFCQTLILPFERILGGL